LPYGASGFAYRFASGSDLKKQWARASLYQRQPNFRAARSTPEISHTEHLLALTAKNHAWIIINPIEKSKPNNNDLNSKPIKRASTKAMSIQYDQTQETNDQPHDAHRDIRNTV